MVTDYLDNTHVMFLTLMQYHKNIILAVGVFKWQNTYKNTMLITLCYDIIHFKIAKGHVAKNSVKARNRLRGQ